jgi:hypothetical protein
MDRKNAASVAWVALYCALVVVVGSVAARYEVSPQWFVPVLLFVLPLVASVPFLIHRQVSGQRHD